MYSLPLLVFKRDSKSGVDQIYKVIERFMLGKHGGVKGKHWVSWDDLCLPKEDRGIRFRSLHTMVNALC